MTLNELYKSKCVTAKEAISNIKDGDTVVLAHAAAEPLVLVEALSENYESFHDVTISHMVSYGTGAYCRPEMEGHFKYNGFFLSANTRNAVDEGRGIYTPMYLHEVPKAIRKGYHLCDVAMVMVSRPDEFGYCYVGVSSDYTMQMIKTANLVLAECNDRVPKTNGTAVHISEIDYIAESSHQLTQLAAKPATEEEQVIGGYCATLVQDDSTLQLGIGGIPSAVMGAMHHKKNLGVHSEMISDWIIDLAEKGIVNGKKKTLHKGKSICTFMVGTDRLYDYVNRNPHIEMYPSDYVNNPIVIRENSNMVSINSCVEVDLMGQIAGESIGLRQFSGTGGQVDFFRGVAMAKDEKGISIVAMPSSTVKKNGVRISKISAFLQPGAAVTSTRNDVDCIVTEYGIAEIKWKSLNDRARNLIKIAHPDFRDELIEEYESRFKEKFL